MIGVAGLGISITEAIKEKLFLAMGLWKRTLVVALFYCLVIFLFIWSQFSELIFKLILSPILLLLCFATLGIITADFLTPNLSVISNDLLLISPRVSGMTLLALGNAIPDISSTYASMKKGASTLAIGESLGAIFFLLTVVIGCMVSIRTIQLSDPHMLSLDLERNEDNLDYWDTIFYSRYQFLRDLFMFGFLISLNIYLLLDSKLEFWECIVMCFAYGAYVTYLLSSGQELEATNNDEEIPEITVSEAPSVDDNLQKFLRMAKETRRDFRQKVRKYLRKNYKGWANLKVNDTLDLWENAGYFDHELDEALSHATSPLLKPKSRRNSETMVREIQQASLAIPYHMHTIQEGSQKCSSAASNEPESLPKLGNELGRNMLGDSLVPISDRKSAPRSVSVDNLCRMNDGESFISDIIPLTDELVDQGDKEVKDSWDSKLRILKYLTDPHYEVHATEVTIILATTPIIFVLTLLIPLNYVSKSGNVFFKIGYYIQCAFTPFIVNLLITKSFNLWLFVFGSAVATVTLPLAYYKVLKLKAKLIAPFGFAISITTISFVVGLVVDVLTDWVKYFQISEAILGLTVFAWGNSIGDLVSNVTFTRIGVLEIALGSCFGSPLLYFLFGVGIDGILVLLKNTNPEDVPFWFWHLDFVVNESLVLSMIGIGIAFFIFIFIVPLNHWKLDQKIGGLLLSLYFLITLINIIIEFKS